MEKNLKFYRKLPIPKEVKAEFPISDELRLLREKRLADMADIFEGRSDRLLLIIGPCSADSEEPVMDYITRLREVEEKVKDKIMIVPRIYTNKPRTTGEGYKGMLHQPDPNSAPDLLKGIIAIRKLHLRALSETGFITADEMLYPENHRYLSDLMGYVAIGARSSEDQLHRLVASGIDVPVGMKNPTGGDIGVMMNSIKAAQSSHIFLYRGWEVESAGNPLCHAILRGYVDKHGKSHPNYHFEDLYGLYETYAKSGLKNPAVIVDTNHANSGKQYLEQPRIAKEVLHSMRYSKEVRSLVKGLMIESYIEDGAQAISDCEVYGKSITDPCLGWDKTEKLIYQLADSL
ncbi:MAG: 3-deoxy-7-phosphoheptulonate synthase [Clostridia bacterium]|nr:3-deoxy-7-phosphoheptulonate synthase [Clostridia bacterium]